MKSQSFDIKIKHLTYLQMIYHPKLGFTKQKVKLTHIIE